jgi:uncharacterized protein YaeQ
MALTATIYNLDIELADIDRGVYESFALRIARQPSETAEYMLTRVLAYCLEYTEGIALTEGVAAGDEPAVVVRDLTGRITAWIDVGMPDAARVHHGSKLAGRVAVYTHRDPKQLLAQWAGERVHNVGDIPVYAFDRALIEDVASHLERRSSLSLSITERELYLELDGRTFSTTIVEHRAEGARS